MPDRREFLERLSAVAVLGALPTAATPGAEVPPPQGRDWDMTWVAKLDGIPHKALFDCTEIESGNGVVRWRDRELRADAYVTFSLTPGGSVSEARMAPASPDVDFSFDFQDLVLKPKPSVR